MANVAQSDGPLLEVRNLVVTFPTRTGRITVLDDVSFAIGRNEVVGLVGESGSGKTLSATAIIGLLNPPACIERGQILLDGEDLLAKPARELQHIRGTRISMIFQTPRTSLNPLLPVGEQVARPFRLRRGLSKRQAAEAAVDMLRAVGIADAPRRARNYPHQLSGGMCQRIMIAMMVACEPDLLIADEPTTALDVTIQAQILDLLADLKRDKGRLSILLISHDLAVIAENCDRVVVMHAGQVVETGSTLDLFNSPAHPYTQRLLTAALGADPGVHVLAPTDTSTLTLPGCRYASACRFAMPICSLTRPTPALVDAGHSVSCHLHHAAA